MFSKILLKLIDQAIVPAILVVATRIISVIYISKSFNVDFSISGANVTFYDAAGYLQVNSYSILSIILVIALGMSLTLASSALFHHEHISPSVTAKLFSLNLNSLIKTSFEVYSKSLIWMSYLWLLMFYTGLMFYYQMVYEWVLYVAIGVTLALTVLLALDIEKKVKLKENDFLFDMDKKFLEEDK